ncbi:MAG: hypothetical protein HQ518_19155 [Rhodopirellula sp.]|nr:hypothetical protein [Rhodopirellula sp.]
MHRQLFKLLILALVAGIANVATAQTLPPIVPTLPPVNSDIDAPASDAGIPALLSNITLPDVQFLFDGLLDPNRISQIEKVTGASLGDARLTNAANSVILNHLVAMQQVELAIQFLQANRDNILAGTNSEYNGIFGNPGALRDVAVVSPTPLSGLATVQTSVGGLVQLDFNDNTMPNLPGQLNAGDYVFVGDAPNQDPTGFVMKVEQIMFDVDGSNQSVTGTGTFGGALSAVNRGMVPVYKIVQFEQRTDPARFERVLQTFTAIRDELSGLNVNLPPALQTSNAITYQRGFTDFNQVWAPGIAPFTPLDQVVQQELSVYGATSTAMADRLIRQAGLSNSNSYDHISNLQSLSTAPTQTTPLLWTEDNNLPSDVNGLLISNATDSSRAFFADRQTIFGEPDNPFTQYIGRAFLDETIRYNAPFFDNQIGVADNSAPQTFTTTTTLGNGQSVTVTQTLTDPLRLFQLSDGSIVQIPGSGTPIIEKTELRKWQMIIESFAEHSSDLSQFNVAAVGVSAISGDFVADDLKARDAGNYARFAALIGGSSGLGTIDFGRIEPFGKRGTAGFNPVVPRN